MICAHTVRRLKPGMFDEFRERFTPPVDDAPAGWVRFHMLRSLADENEVVTFGFFDGTLEQMNQSQDESDFAKLRESIDPLVDDVVTNGVYEIVESLAVDGTAA